MLLQTLDPTLSAELSKERHYDEHILWTGRPNPIRAAMRDSYRLWSALATLGGAAFMLFILNQFFSGFGSFGLPGMGSFTSFFVFVLAFGIVVSLAPIVNDYLRAGRTLYAVTDKRLLVLTLPALWWGRSVQSYGPQDITQITRRGSGDVFFATETISMRRKYGYSTRTVPVGFYGISGAQEVERLIMEHFKPS